jgi:dTDP-glucose pyrophosphorylase
MARMIDIKKICIGPQATMMDAIESLNRSGHGIVLVCQDNSNLLGTITDADIRKALANKKSFKANVVDVMHASPAVVQRSAPKKFVLNEFVRTSLRALPEVDDDGCVVGCFFREDFTDLKVSADTLMIMAGGFGTRMGDLTQAKPKPLLEVRGKPMIQHIIEMAVAEKFDQIVISTHYLSHMIEDFCGDGTKFGTRISYIKEPKPLGTGGSFGLLENISGPVVVTNSDIMSTIGYRQLLEFHSTHHAAATMAVREHHIQNPFGVVLNDGVHLTGFEEKPIWKTNINAGIYVLDSSLCRLLDKDEVITMPEVFDRIRQAGERTLVYPLYEHWTDLGSEAEYDRYK